MGEVKQGYNRNYKAHQRPVINRLRLVLLTGWIERLNRRQRSRRRKGQR